MQYLILMVRLFWLRIMWAMHKALLLYVCVGIPRTNQGVRIHPHCGQHHPIDMKRDKRKKGEATA